MEDDKVRWTVMVVQHLLVWVALVIIGWGIVGVIGFGAWKIVTGR